MYMTRYGWRRHYEAALVETDPARLPELINSAQSAIHTRLQQLQLEVNAAPDEQDAISDALAGLRILAHEAAAGQECARRLRMA